MMLNLRFSMIRPVFRSLTALSLCATVAVAESDKTSLWKLWRSSHYSSKTIPEAWRPTKIPATSSDLNSFESLSAQENLSIPKFIARYGLPHRYLITERKDGQDFLIYDLPSGHAVALYVSKPPVVTFSACVIITSDGSLVRLIK